MTDKDEVSYYRDLYEQEKKKTAKLSDRLADANRKAEDLQENLDRIKNSGLWKAAKPARDAYHFLKRTGDRVGQYCSPKGIARKVKSKMIEKQARLQHGTRSFPDENQRKAEESRVFPKVLHLWKDTHLL